MVRDQRTLEAALEDKGFRKREGDHHHYVYWGLDHKKSMAKTKTSHGGRGATISANLFSQMAKQVHLSTQEFADLVDCPLSRQQYDQLLRKRNAL
jgi:hypothetical protein